MKSSKTIWIIVVVALTAGLLFQFRSLIHKNRELNLMREQLSLGEWEQKKQNNFITEITTVMSEVEDRLQEISSRQVTMAGLVTKGETDMSQKSKILNDISLIEQQLQKDKEHIRTLQSRIQRTETRNTALESMLSNLESKIVASETTMTELRELVTHKEMVISEKELVIKATQDSLDVTQTNLEIVSNQLDETTRELEDAKNTAYYVIGTRKELRDKNVLSATGFIFKTVNLSRNFDTSAFTKLDITQQMEFEFDCSARNVTLMPSRPDNSYILENTGPSESVLRITDLDKFWRISYLIVVVKS